MATSVTLVVTDNAELQRYEARRGPDVVGFITYRLQPERMTLIHTQVAPALEGHGIGSQFVGGALDDIRRRDLTIVPICPFVRAYLRRHPEYTDLVTRK